MSERVCRFCGGSMEGKRRQALYCSDGCRKEDHRQRGDAGFWTGVAGSTTRRSWRWHRRPA